MKVEKSSGKAQTSRKREKKKKKNMTTGDNLNL
jgi:hypothetical protein